MATKTRDATNGRFVEGNPGGPGRPRRAVEADYLRVLTDVCTLDVWRSICERAVEKAKHGDARARAWLSEYLLGPESLVPGSCVTTTTRLIDLAATEADPKLIPGKIESRRDELAGEAEDYYPDDCNS